MVVLDLCCFLFCFVFDLFKSKLDTKFGVPHLINITVDIRITVMNDLKVVLDSPHALFVLITWRLSPSSSTGTTTE